MKSLRFGVAAALGLTALLAASPIESPVADAAMRRDREAVRSLVQQGADVNAAQGDGMTALHWAAANGDLEMARMLIFAGSNLEAITRIGAFRPIHVAGRAGSGDVVAALVAAGADAKAVTTTGVTPLHFAAGSGAVQGVTALLDAGANVDAREPAWGHTPLMLAAAHNRAAAITLLIGRGADPKLTAVRENTPDRQTVDGAAQTARRNVLEAFRAQAPNPELWRPTPGQVQAAVNAALEVERRALAGGAPVATADAGGRGAGGGGGGEGAEETGSVYGGLTALLLAVRDGQMDAVRALADGGADLNQVREGDNTSPMLLAAINGSYDMVKFLLDRGADPNVYSTDGAGPLYAVINKEWAPRSRHPQPTYHRQQQLSYLELMEALLQGGAEPNARLKAGLWYTSPGQNDLGVDFRGATPFFRAAHATDVVAMKLLVSYGADPTLATIAAAGGGGRGGGRGGGAGGAGAADPSGLPPVQAGGVGTPPVVVAAGAGYGLGYAANTHEHAPDGWLPTMKYLVEELGQDVKARDAAGYTAMHFAAARGDDELIMYLIEKGADVTAVARNGRTTADMANGPFQRISPYLGTVALLERLGSKNNHNCVSC
jgi:ankyrin repeat protein